MSIDLNPEWSTKDCELFDRMYTHALGAQRALAGEGCTISSERWAAICWNMAWVATHMSRSSRPLVHADESGRLLAVETRRGLPN